jgi:hypothetical protein
MTKVAEIGNIQVSATFVRGNVEAAGPRIRHQSRHSAARHRRQRSRESLKLFLPAHRRAEVIPAGARDASVPSFETGSSCHWRSRSSSVAPRSRMPLGRTVDPVRAEQAVGVGTGSGSSNIG